MIYARTCTSTNKTIYNVYIIVDLVKQGVVTLVGEILRNRN